LTRGVVVVGGNGSVGGSIRYEGDHSSHQIKNATNVDKGAKLKLLLSVGWDLLFNRWWRLASNTSTRLLLIEMGGHLWGGGDKRLGTMDSVQPMASTKARGREGADGKSRGNRQGYT